MKDLCSRTSLLFPCACAVLGAVLCAEEALSQAVSEVTGSAAKTHSPRNNDQGEQAAESRSPFHIRGTVIDSVTKSPVVRTALAVSPMGARRGNSRFAGRAAGQTASAITDAGGHFDIEVSTAGGWSLSAAAHGYHSQTYDEHDRFSTAIILTDAKPTEEVTFRLAPGAIIEGFVLDEAGEAVRNAQLTVSLLPPAAPDDPHPRPQNRGTQKTDDRGYYKFSGLLAGSYDLRVQAQPWYATNGNGNGGADRRRVTGIASTGSGSIDGSTGSSDSLVPDSLDVVYPVLWYPGVTDFMASTPMVLRGGEKKEADFRMLPVPGFHLRVAEKSSTSDESSGTSGRRVISSNAYLSEMFPDGTEAAAPLPMRIEADGAMEFSGLAPGTYVVHRQGEAEAASSATIRITSASTHQVDMNQAIAEVPVQIHIDVEAGKAALQITLKDVESGRVSFAQSSRDFGEDGLRQRIPSTDKVPANQSEQDPPDRFVNLQPGRYEVTLSGASDLHLVSIAAKGATATGRTVTVTDGSPVLTLHLAAGRADVTGFVRSHDKPVAGAMILLVPATLGDPSGLNVMRRDQSNTDGSFDITGVLPGKYILVAIDHGWDVNWSDPATLRRFLMHGFPLDLTVPSDRKVTVEAQSP